MKPLLLLLISIMLCSFTGKTNNSLRVENMKGKVKCITEYIVSNGKGGQEIFGKNIYLYDKRGNKILYKFYNRKDSLAIVNTWKYKYNKDGNKTEEYGYNTDGSLVWKFIFTYDKNGIIIETKKFEYPKMDVVKERYAFQYDALGTKTGAVVYNMEGVQDCRITYRYNVNKSLVEVFEKDNQLGEEQEKKELRKYNSKGTLIEIDYSNREQNKSEKFYQKYFLDFDHSGNWIKMAWVSPSLFSNKRDTLIYKREISYY